MRKIIIALVVVAAIGTGGFFYYQSRQSAEPVTSSVANTEESAEPTATTPSFNKTKYSLHDPTSIWVVVNKKNSIPTSFAPDLTVPDVRLRLAASEQQMQISKTIEPAIEEMFAAAKAEGITLVFGSGYRSATLQKQFYDSYVARSGQAAADTYSARPGHSEHQTGLALDVTGSSGTCHLEICWKDTPEGKWLATNAYKYGFIIRYQEGKESITGYQYEPWHIRFVGKELSAQINQTNQTLEEFFEIGPANTYD